MQSEWSCSMGTCGSAPFLRRNRAVMKVLTSQIGVCRGQGHAGGHSRVRSGNHHHQVTGRRCASLHSVLLIFLHTEACISPAPHKVQRNSTFLSCEGFRACMQADAAFFSFATEVSLQILGCPSSLLGSYRAILYIYIYPYLHWPWQGARM
jgi:hypothetical protein